MKIENLAQNIVRLLKNAQHSVLQTVNQTMVMTYFEIGRMVVEEEQAGKQRAMYGTKLLKALSEKLTQEFGKGFSEDNLSNMRKFYLVYHAQISETMFRKSTDTNTPFKYWTNADVC